MTPNRQISQADREYLQELYEQLTQEDRKSTSGLSVFSIYETVCE